MQALWSTGSFVNDSEPAFGSALVPVGTLKFSAAPVNENHAAEQPAAACVLSTLTTPLTVPTCAALAPAFVADKLTDDEPPGPTSLATTPESVTVGAVLDALPVAVPLPLAM